TRRSSASSARGTPNQSSESGGLKNPQPTTDPPSVQIPIRSDQSTPGPAPANHQARSPMLHEISGRRGVSQARVTAACISRRSSGVAYGRDSNGTDGGY